jgi:hypothetical protein
MAANDRPSAYVQWLQLPEAERRAGDSLGAALVATLGQIGTTNNESCPQMWVAGREIRNLRMVANMRETFRERPGARVLSIVGASHKPWFDTWLGQLQGVDIVDTWRF